MFIFFSLFIVMMKALLFWFIMIAIISLYILHKNRTKLRKEDIITSAVLSIMVMLSNLFIAIFLFLGYLAAATIMHEVNQKIVLYHSKKEKELKKTIVCMVLIGSILAMINILFASSIYSIQISFEPAFILNALQIAIFEEILFRMFLFALCTYITKGVSYTKFQAGISYLLMTLPRVLVHFSGGINIINMITLLGFFGLPLALIQRKVNLFSAIGVHFIIDFSRMIVLGI